MARARHGGAAGDGARDDAVSPRQYHVYVVELDPAYCERGRCPARNGRPPVYVGQSFRAPAERLEQHLRGYRGSRSVRTYGRRLLPELSAGNGPYATRAEAEAAETMLAQRLWEDGYCVLGGT